MKAQLISNEVITNNIGSISSFSIKASSKAFSILSDGLYSNKIVAIIREIGCNAIDAHKMVGKELLPIEVKLPNSFDNTFHIKDFGPGLSHEQIVGYWTDTNPPVYVGGLYNTYFESTKTDSNDFIGALGLGSKSPFSYVPNFIVESRQNGICNVYTCFKDENGLPSVTLLSSYDTEEDNGLTIKLVVKLKDISEFISAAKQVFTYFDVVPNVIGYVGFVPEQITYTFSGTNWKFCKYERYTSDDYAQTTKVIQGSIAYPIDKDVLITHDKMTPTALSSIHLPIHYFVNIGDVDVAASREALSYDERTIVKLIELMEQSASEMHDIIQKRYDECTSEWEAGITKLNIMDNDNYYSKMDRVYKGLEQVTPFTWNNLPIPKEVVLPTLKKTNIRSYYYKNGNKLVYTNSYYRDMPIIQKTVVFVDQHNNTVIRCDELLKEYLQANNIHYKPKLIIIKQHPKFLDQTELDSVIGLFSSDVHIINVGPKEKKVRTVTQITKTNKISTIPFDDTNSLKELDIDLVKDKYLYVHYNKQKVVTPDGQLFTHNINHTINALNNSFGLLSNVGFIGVCFLSTSQLKIANKNTNSINLFDYVVSTIDNMSLENDITRYVANYVTSCIYLESREYSIYQYIIYQYAYHDIDNLKNTQFGKFASKLHDNKDIGLCSFGSNNYFEYTLRSLNLLQKLDIQPKIDALTQEWTDIKTKYPLLVPAMYQENWRSNNIQPNEDRTKLVQDIIDYFTLVDQK